MKVCILLAWAAVAAVPPCALASSNDLITAVSSRTSDDYIRVKLSDGSFQPETYAFGEGGHMTGAVSDATIERISFMEMARTIAVPLADQHYLPTRDAKSTKLLILVYYGRTRTPGSPNDSMAVQSMQKAAGTLAQAKDSNTAQFAAAATVPTSSSGMACGHFDPTISAGVVADQLDADNALSGAMALVAAENRSRDQINLRNAVLIGYDTLWSSTAGYAGTPLEYRRQDLSRELEEGRYFVVLMAYDFQAIWKLKKHKLLWETRFSVRQRDHDFQKDLLVIAQNASQYFGQDTHGLVRKALPEGRVDIGELKTLASDSEK